MIDPIALHRKKFPYLTEDDFLLMVQHSRMVDYKMGDVLHRPGDYHWDIGLLLKGLIRIYHITEDGNDKTVHFVKEGEDYGDPFTLFLNEPCHVTAVALEDTSLLLTDWRKQKELIETNASVARLHRAVLEDNIAKLARRLEGFTINSPERRYLNFMENYPDLMQRVPLKHIASYLGITQVSLSRMRKRIHEKRRI